MPPPLRTFYFALYKYALYCYVHAAYCDRRTDGVASSVCHDHEPCKTAEPIEMPLGCGMGYAQESTYEGAHSSTWRNCPCAAAIQPYVKLLPPLVMAALCNRAGHYVFALWFLLSSVFPRLISAVANWMSTILPHMVWP